MAILYYSSLPLLLFFWSTFILTIFRCCVVASSDDATTTTTTSEEGRAVVVSLELELHNYAAAKTTGAADKEIDSDGNVPRCAEWAAQGECDKNPRYMLQYCAATCHSRDNKPTVTVYDGEDVGVAAFRFAEEFSDLFPSHEAILETVMDVARKLQDLLEAEAGSYKPPKELTHCGGKRPCSAGKLWKRAEEMRKADMHDHAGADLIRALLKTGIEIDFVNRCQQSLVWAFGSIQRQRQREEREKAEEAKLFERKEQERKAMEEALERKKEYEADFVKFGTKLQESMAQECSATKEEGKSAGANAGTDGAPEEGSTDTHDAEELVLDIKRSFVEAGPRGGNWSETLRLLKKLRPSEKNTDTLLIEARCHEMVGDHKSALSAAGHLIQKAASYTPWINDSPRMMAVTLGANAAMQLGLPDHALSFYQTVLKHDPEQEKTRKQYRGLKKVVKLMGKADEQIEKGYNKAASVFVEDCLSAMRGLDVDSPMFRSKIQLKQCTILSATGKHEEALDHCDSAVEQIVTNNDSVVVSNDTKKEAYLVRGEALLLDMDYDEAVQDFRSAFDLVPENDPERLEEKRELHQKLQQTKRQQELWNGGTKDMRYNENTGFPDGRPPERDHAKILQLPIDLEQRSKETKCAWLKKQFKLLVRKFHPDKYKGNKNRAARKFKEVKEAKDIISKEWDC